MDPIIFVSRNASKASEYLKIFSAHGMTSIQEPADLTEIQDPDADKIVREKAISAYRQIGRKLFVEHTSFEIEYLNGFPSGLTSHFIEMIGESKICDLFGSGGREAACGVTRIGYCDGKRIHVFKGLLKGRVSDRPSGGTDPWSSFGWNRIFIPDGFDKTLADIGIDVKNEISMRKRAASELIDHLRR
ncbi:non-canonical purine NTP pyrophosphatase [Rhizobium leguminosarum]|uniref:non-canonical purine NTP pyrophosphatase n=1 Tax=Rhizobium leguminosarum TaxID=384 RepID=UPI001C93E353|nr:non-canonical purine NTP pyrophosphatase [Rhizobium leguminosarum]MBY5738157.1 non-canonical purine NTP pyrophosphatase [Rhizobium leguminosarum]